MKGDEEPILERRYDWSETAPSVAVVEAIAAVAETDPADVPIGRGTSLYDVVDTDALDALVTHGPEISVTVPVDDYLVRLRGPELAVYRHADPDA